ncbi:MAG: hypothetical protein HYX96_08240 [Chloroflexi bacterium]|nr:hypothetical protein [Chloroflexota bacterium]
MDFWLTPETGLPRDEASAGEWDSLVYKTRARVSEPDETVDELRGLGCRLIVAEQRHRRRIAKRIDDSISQRLTSCEIGLGLLIKSADEAAREQLVQMRRAVQLVLQDARNLNSALSQSVLYELGLEAAISDYLGQVQKENAVRCFFVDDRQPKPLDENVRDFLYTAVEDLVQHAVRSCGTETLNIRVTRQGGEIEISIEDDGCGLNEDDMAVTLGPAGIRECLAYFGGRLVTESDGGLGSRVTLTAPLRDSDQVLNWG